MIEFERSVEEYVSWAIREMYPAREEKKMEAEKLMARNDRDDMAIWQWIDQ